jgi:hypothetical protein
VILFDNCDLLGMIDGAKGLLNLFLKMAANFVSAVIVAFPIVEK